LNHAKTSNEGRLGGHIVQSERPKANQAFLLWAGLTKYLWQNLSYLLFFPDFILISGRKQP
jgi:hypothetical protein